MHISGDNQPGDGSVPEAQQCIGPQQGRIQDVDCRNLVEKFAATKAGLKLPTVAVDRRVDLPSLLPFHINYKLPPCIPYLLPPS